MPTEFVEAPSSVTTVPEGVEFVKMIRESKKETGFTPAGTLICESMSLRPSAKYIPKVFEPLSVTLLSVRLVMIISGKPQMRPTMRPDCAEPTTLLMVMSRKIGVLLVTGNDGAVSTMPGVRLLIEPNVV